MAAAELNDASGVFVWTLMIESGDQTTRTTFSSARLAHLSDEEDGKTFCVILMLQVIGRYLRA